MSRLSLICLLTVIACCQVPSIVDGQDVFVHASSLNNEIVCYVMTGKKNGRSADFCGSGADAMEAEACARTKMRAAGYAERSGGVVECSDEACEGDTSCTNVMMSLEGTTSLPMSPCAPTYKVDLDCIACDGTCIPVTGESSESWCKAYSKAKATAERIAKNEGHGFIKCCKVVVTCPQVNCCTPVKHRLFGRFRR